jgi:hypothetical protein
VQFRTGKDAGHLFEKLKHLADLEARYSKFLRNSYSKNTYAWLDVEIHDLLVRNFPKAKGTIDTYFSRLGEMWWTIDKAFDVWQNRSHRELEFVNELQVTTWENFKHTLHDLFAFRKRSVVEWFRSDLLALMNLYKESAAQKSSIARKLSGDDDALRAETAAVLKLFENKKQRLRNPPYPDEDRALAVAYAESYVEKKREEAHRISSSFGSSSSSSFRIGNLGGSSFGGFGGGRSGGGGASGSW